jgi:Protein of unknown function (DUF4019)
MVGSTIESMSRLAQALLLAMPNPMLRFSFFACFVALQACSNWSSHLSTRQVAAYSAAIGFLGLCDSNDFATALERYGRPIKSGPDSATWVTKTQAERAHFGPPILRSWINRQGLNDSANLTFRFRTSFSQEPLVDEIVSVKRTSGVWQVYEYKFHALGKHPSPSRSVTPGGLPTPVPLPQSTPLPLPLETPFPTGSP